jgi:hypothetical protein
VPYLYAASGTSGPSPWRSEREHSAIKWEIPKFCSCPLVSLASRDNRISYPSFWRLLMNQQMSTTN